MKNVVAMLLCASAFSSMAFASQEQDLMKDLNYSCFINLEITNPNWDDDRSTDGALTKLIPVADRDYVVKIATASPRIRAIVGPRNTSNEVSLSIFFKTGSSEEIHIDKNANVSEVTVLPISVSRNSKYLRELAKACDDKKRGYSKTDEIALICGPKKLLDERFHYSSAVDNCSKLR